MSKIQEKMLFAKRMDKYGVTLRDCERLIRQATTIDRLAVAMCNGDWPADNGERETVPCPKCGSFWVPSTIKKGRCQDCAAAERVAEILKDYSVSFSASGDPRGYTLTIIPAGADPDNSSQTIGVPSNFKG